MPAKLAEEIERTGWSMFKRHVNILNEEALARGYSGTSELVRDIFEAWIEENHKFKAS